jgi:hypothetical protein
MDWKEIEDALLDMSIIIVPVLFIGMLGALIFG